MARQITFTSGKEAREYAHQKEQEGYKIDICRKEHTYMVSLLNRQRVVPEGKSRRLNLPPYLFKEWQQRDYTPSQLYKRICQERIRPKRTKEDITEIAKEEMGKANINVLVKVGTPPNSLAGATVESEDTKTTIIIHPIHKYSEESYLREVIKHEINHIREDNVKLD